MFFKRKTENKTDTAKACVQMPECEGKLNHIAFIMDGNGRWAKARLMPRKYGHKYGAENLRRVARHCKELGIKTVTVYAFSTENWIRPKDEVESIMKLLDRFLNESIRDAEKNEIRFIVLGDRSALNNTITEKINRLESMTANYAYTLNLALNYGARAEITHAVNSLISKGKKSVTEDDISGALYTSKSPDPDLIVRTGGDLRLSNFLLWQAAYSEFFFTKTLWPDLDEAEIDMIVSDFLSRDRRFGNVKE
ncbi:MAG: polyprenyl diphosphate synthase [Eubacteriales bacterium]|nr:polyprenyl diphosphate synthase [Eubacteriales bacterium]